MPFIERAPAVDIMTDSSIGPKQMSVQLRHWDKTANYLIETALHGGTDLADTDDYDERFGYTGRVVYAPSFSKSQVLHLHSLFLLSYKNEHYHPTLSQLSQLELTYLVTQTILQ